jgi:hypothetical protein
MYREMVDPGHTCEWIEEDDLAKKGLVIARRSNCILQSERLKEIGADMRPISIALRDAMEKYAKAKRGE